MPTEKQVTFYCCDVCGCEHRNYGKAMDCQQKPILDDIEKLRRFEVGAELCYQSEWAMGGRWVYESAGGKIAEVKIITSENNHHYMYVVENEHRGCTEGVIWVKDDFGWKLMSFAEMKFRDGQ